ncbi:MAG: dihydrodipicolinate synthase family protein [Acidobacteria bacterium]|nr:dihydrodipicolinate synthase family protein [Acidobacteriota bacterium]
MHVSGVFAPIPTPFTASGALHLDAWRANLERWVGTGLHGLVVLGSNGEAPLVDDDESEQLVATAREHIPADRLLIAGTGRQSTKCAVDASRRAAHAGADAVLVRTPSYFKGQLTTASFVRHYVAVADACPVPVLLYNFTGLTGVTLPVAAVSTLSQHENIIGIKESGSDLSYVGDLIDLAHSKFSVLVGSGPTFFPSLMLGADGGIMALACVAPAACLRIYELVRAGRHDEARALQRQVVPLAKLVTSVHGIPGLKAALAHLGYVGGPARPPLEPIAADAVQQIGRTLDALAGAMAAVPV